MFKFCSFIMLGFILSLGLLSCTEPFSSPQSPAAPEPGDQAREEILAVQEAVFQYHRDAQALPLDLETLVHLGYYRPNAVVNQDWQFFLIPLGEWVDIEALSTNRMREGGGHI